MGQIGAESGLGLHPGANGFSSLLAYTIKEPDSETFREVADGGTETVIDPRQSG